MLNFELPILETIGAIEVHNDVRVLQIKLGGSHAWGYATEKSDTDFRFVYIRKWQHYLTTGRNPTLVLDRNNLAVDDPLQRHEQSLERYGEFYTQYEGIDLQSLLRRVGSGSSEVHRLAVMPSLFMASEFFANDESLALAQTLLDLYDSYNPNAVLGTARDVYRQQTKTDPRQPSDPRFWMRVRHYLSGLHEAQKAMTATGKRDKGLARIQELSLHGPLAQEIVPDRTMSEAQGQELWKKLGTYHHWLEQEFKNQTRTVAEMDSYLHRVMQYFWSLT